MQWWLELAGVVAAWLGVAMLAIIIVLLIVAVWFVYKELREDTQPSDVEP